MHRNPVQSMLFPSRPPAPQSGVDPGAMNSGSANTSAIGLLTADVESESLEERGGSVAFLSYHVVQVDRAECDRRGGANWWSAQESSAWKERVLVEEDGQASVVRVRVQLVRDVRGHGRGPTGAKLR